MDIYGRPAAARRGNRDNRVRPFEELFATFAGLGYADENEVLSRGIGPVEHRLVPSFSRL